MNKQEITRTLKQVFELSDAESLGVLLGRDDAMRVHGLVELINLLADPSISDKHAAIQCEQVIVAIRIQAEPSPLEQALVSAFDKASD